MHCDWRLGTFFRKKQKIVQAKRTNEYIINNEINDAAKMRKKEEILNPNTQF